MYFQIRNNLRQLEPLKDIIRPIYIINFVLVLRYLILLIDFIIWLASDGEYSLKDFYQNLMWLIIVYESRKILDNQDFIQVTNLRNPILNELLQRMTTVIAVALIFTVVSSFILESLIFEIFGYLLFVAAVFVLYKRFKEEQAASSSKLVKLRWDYYSWAWLLAFAYVLTTALSAAIILMIYSDEIDSTFFIVFQLLNNIIPLAISFNFYWFVFLPERGRRRYSLLNPKDFLE